MTYQNKHYRWTPKQLSTHRKRKLINAIRRRDLNYFLERQEKFSRVFPNTLGAVANFTFLEGFADDGLEQ